jgi:L-arabinose isomerase
MAGVELVLIDETTSIRQLQKELRWNEAYHHLAKGI